MIVADHPQTHAHPYIRAQGSRAGRFDVTRTRPDLPLAAAALDHHPANRASRRAFLGEWRTAPRRWVHRRPPSRAGCHLPVRLVLPAIDNDTTASIVSLRRPPVPVSARRRNAPRAACVPVPARSCGPGSTSRVPSTLPETSPPEACAHSDSHITRLRRRWIAFTLLAQPSFYAASPFKHLIPPPRRLREPQCSRGRAPLLTIQLFRPHIATARTRARNSRMGAVIHRLYPAWAEEDLHGARASSDAHADSVWRIFCPSGPQGLQARPPCRGLSDATRELRGSCSAPRRRHRHSAHLTPTGYETQAAKFT